MEDGTGEGSRLAFGDWKLRPPSLPTNVADLPTAERLAAALQRVPFVSVVAPAGSGKSTTLAAWSATPGPHRPLWVRLDSQDDDPHVLAAALSTSIRRTFSVTAQRVESLLRSSTPPDVRQLATAIALDLDELDGVAVVLDDLHHLREMGSLDLVESMIDNLGTSSRVVTASRVEPPLNLTQRRVRRSVVEFSAADLRLDISQVAGLLDEVGIHGDALADTILRRSGGWAAAAVLLATHADPRSTLETTDAPSTLRGEIDIDEFLRAEVLDRMEPELRDFVLKTSLLASLDTAACSAVSGTRRAPELLEEVRRHALAEVVNDTAEVGSASLRLRYHDRIAAFLRSELARCVGPEERIAIHRSAAAVSPPMHAIELLLAVDDIEGASSTVTDVGRLLLDNPGTRVPRSWLTPFSDDQLTARPWLAVLSGLAAIEDGDITAAFERLAPAVDSMRASGDLSGFVRGAYGLAEANLARGQVEEAAGLIDELLDLDLSSDERVRVLTGKLWLDYFGGDWTGVESALTEAFTLAFRSCSETGRCSVALGLGTEFLFAPRGVAWLSDHAAELARRIDNDIMALTNLELIDAAAHLITGRIDMAQEIAVDLDERSLELGSLNWLAMAADRVRLGVALATGDRRAVSTIVDSARRLLGESDRHRQERAMYAYAMARSLPEEGRLAALRAARVLLGEVSAEDRPDTTVTAAVLDALILRDEGDPDGAEAALVAVRDLHHRIGFWLLTGLVDLELAAVRLESGRSAEAVETARPTLMRLAEIGGAGILLMDGRGTHRAVLEACRSDKDVGTFVTEALVRLAEPTTAAGLVVPDTGERITSRELEVLRLVIEGDSNRAIAERLFIGERTVKSHMTSILRKLGVTSRTAAIAACRELGVG